MPACSALIWYHVIYYYLKGGVNSCNYLLFPGTFLARIYYFYAFCCNVCPPISPFIGNGLVHYSFFIDKLKVTGLREFLEFYFLIPAAISTVRSSPRNDFFDTPWRTCTEMSSRGRFCRTFLGFFQQTFKTA